MFHQLFVGTTYLVRTRKGGTFNGVYRGMHGSLAVFTTNGKYRNRTVRIRPEAAIQLLHRPRRAVLDLQDRRVPLRRESKVRASCGRQNWVGVHPDDASKTKPKGGNARATAGRCFCPECLS
jgi:hypothetical protein